MRKIAFAIGTAALLAAGSTAAQAQLYQAPGLEAVPPAEFVPMEASQIPGLQAVAYEAGILVFDSGDQMKLEGPIDSVTAVGSDLLVAYEDGDGGPIKTTVIDLSAWS